MARVLVNRVVRRGCLIFYRVEIVFFFFLMSLEPGRGYEYVSFRDGEGASDSEFVAASFSGFFLPSPLLLVSLPHCASTDIIATVVLALLVALGTFIAKQMAANGMI